MNTVFKVLLQMALSLSIGLPAAMASTIRDVAMVTSVQGKVVMGTNAVTPFMRVDEGAVLKVGDGAQVQVTYFDNGRQETWNAASEFKVGGARSEAVKGQVAMLRTLPQVIVNQIRDMPVKVASGRVGAVRVREVGGDAGISAVKRQEILTNYTKLRDDPQQGLMADAYLLHAFFKAGSLSDVEQHVQRLKSTRADNPQAQELVKIFETALGKSANDTVRN